MPIKQKGFTLTELLVVVTIIVILGLAILVGINPMSQLFKGYDARRKSDLSQIKIAMEAYYTDHDCYPAFPLKDSLNRPSYSCGSDLLKPYLESMPCDPNTKTPYTIYIIPENSTCPQQFAVYAQIYSFFDSQANNIDYCPKTIAFASPGMLNTDIIFGCSFHEVCSVLYGCVDFQCVVVAEDGRSTCNYDYCESDCDNNCNKPNRQCH